MTPQPLENIPAFYQMTRQPTNLKHQVRQRVDHKRTFFYLEQLLLKHSAHTKALSIQSFRDGMDFFFTRRNEVSGWGDSSSLLRVPGLDSGELRKLRNTRF